jgi:hypothetical protein
MKRTLVLFGLILWAFTFCISTVYCQDAAQQTPAQQHAMAEPYSVKADKLGETLAEWKANNPADYCNNDTVDGLANSAVDPDVIFCSPSGTRTYADQEELSESASFYKGHLFRVQIFLYNMLRLPPVMTALKEKFGTPSGHEATPLHNGFGARFDAHKWRWTNGVSTIELAYIDEPGPDCPIVTFTLDSIYKEIKDRQQKYKATKTRSDM